MVDAHSQSLSKSMVTAVDHGIEADLPESLAASRDEIARLRHVLRMTEDRERALAHELQHGVNNMLAVIRSIFRRTRESGASPDEFAEHFEGRLDAVTRYWSSFTFAPGWRGTELQDVIRDELLRVHVADDARTVIAGPPVWLKDKTLELVGLAIHELTTNAIKFGAFFHHGILNVSWALSGSAEWPVLRLLWQESCVPSLSLAPRPRGFGQTMLEDALPYQLGGITSFNLRPGGIECMIELPLPSGSTDWPVADLPASDHFGPPAEPE